MMKRILVTGGTGLIGRQALTLLRARGYEIHATTTRSSLPDELISNAATWHQVDLMDPAAAAAVIREVRPEGLLHLAWAVSPGGYDDEVHRTWLKAGRELIRSFDESGGTRIVVAGTCFEYDWSSGVCTEEQTPTRPNTLYGTCKDELRQFVEEYCTGRPLTWAWGRIFFVYGPHELPRRLVPSVIVSLLRGEPARCTHGRQVRDYLHSRDVAAALIRLLESEWSGSCNIGSGRPSTLREIGEQIGDRLGGRSLLQFGARPAPENEPPVILADTGRLNGEIGWEPEIGLSDGLEETIAWWRRELGLPPADIS